MKLWKVISVTFVIILLLATACFVFAVWQMKGPGGEQAVEVNIPKNASGREVAYILRSRGVIKNELLFRIMLHKYKVSAIQAGKFVLNPNDSVSQIIDKLSTSNPELILTTIPEGLTVKETAELLASHSLCSSDDFMKIVKSGEFTINGRPLKSLEGYLFPETYNFPPDMACEKIVSTMLDEFKSRFLNVYESGKDGLPVKLSLHDVVVLASLVEREAKIPQERSMIAGVYYNRLKRNMKLQCDATVMYALDEKKEVLSYKDLEIDSPYNTYKYSGLPPEAIANPGMDSLKAVMSPAEHEFLYYVRNDVKNDGSHVFSKTMEEHEKAIVKYQR